MEPFHLLHFCAVARKQTEDGKRIKKKERIKKVWEEQEV